MKQMALAFLLAAPLMGCQQATPLDLKDVWARDTVGGTANAAVYLTITSGIADRLLSASTPVAKRTDLMTMESGRGAMEMKYLKGIEVPAGSVVSLNPSGLHVWLADLNQPLKAGQSFPLTLKFEKAGERQVTVSVIKPAAAPPMSGM